MQKVKIISARKSLDLENLVNEFIADKKVISVSYNFKIDGIVSLFTCCILYEE